LTFLEIINRDMARIWKDLLEKLRKSRRFREKRDDILKPKENLLEINRSGG